MIDIKKIEDLISEGDSETINEEVYLGWKVWYDQQEDYEKVEHLLGAMSQFLLDPESHAARAVLRNTVVFTHRWSQEKHLEDF